MKFGILGGTFNPMHVGHLSIAIQVYRKFFLNYTFFLPSGTPPHKNLNFIVARNFRYEMISRFLTSRFPFKISVVELMWNEITYTIDTIFYLKSLLRKNDELFLILGIDAFLELHTWKNYRTLLSQINIIIVSRYSIDKNNNFDLFKQVCKYINGSLYFGSGVFFNNTCWFGREVCDIKTVQFFRIKSPNLSSSNIRFLFKSNKNLKVFTPLLVYSYIKRKGLYS